MQRRRARILDLGFCAAAGILGTVGAAAVAGIAVAQLVIMGALAAIILVGAVLRPRFSLWLGVIAPGIQLLWPLSGVRALVLLGLLASFCVSLPHAAKRQRAIAVAMLILGLVACMNGVFASAPNAATVAVALNLSYGVVLGANVVAQGLRLGHLSVVLAAWGVTVSGWLVLHHTSDLRAGALFIGLNANSLGLIAVLGCLSSLSLALAQPRHIWWAPIAALCAYGMVLTGSRGALLSLLIGAVALVTPKKLLRSRFGALVALCVMICIASVAWSRLASSYLSIANRDIGATGDLGSRRDVLQYSTDVGLAHPIVGVGFGQLQVLANSASALGTEISSHNTFTGLFASTGALPLVLLTALFVVAIDSNRSSGCRPLLSLTLAIGVAGMSIEWYPNAILCPLCFLVLGCALAPRQRRASAVVGLIESAQRQGGASSVGKVVG